MLGSSSIRSLALAIHLLTFGPAIAQEAASTSPPTGTPSMQDFMKFMQPGEAHKTLATMTGKWRAQMKTWNSATPNRPPVESTEESTSRLVLGGRFVVEEGSGTMMGMPMQRMSLLGYDNYKRAFTQIFYSSFGTATNIAHGSVDSTGKIITLHGEFDDPTGKYPFKNVIRLQSDDLHIFESYRIYPGGREFKVIEGIYTRVAD